MLKDDLFKITLSNHLDNTIHAALELNKNNDIFTGHFPGRPVLPGACMLQIVKEVLENALNISLRLKKADQIKFLHLINPRINNTVQLNITYRLAEDNQIYIAANIATSLDVSFKFKGTFIVL